MRKKSNVPALLILLWSFQAILFFPDAATATPIPLESPIGRRVPDFVIHDSQGKQVALSDLSEKPVVAVVFLGTDCPIANGYIPYLNELQKKHEAKGLQILGINANLSDDIDSVAEHLKEFDVQFPIWVDAKQSTLDLFSATRTPEAFVLDRRRHIRYAGRIDDRLGYTFRNGDAKKRDLENAISQLLEGKKVETPTTRVKGCLITRRTSLIKPGSVTYTSDIAEIFEKRCNECHHEGTAAPFSLQTLEDARNWSEMIREVVQQRRMPPWSADPRHGHFSNDLRMPQEEIDKIAAWIDHGLPAGKLEDAPKPKQFAEGWTIEEPDLVFKMPREFNVPASGTVDYQYFVTPTNFEEDVWVQASEARPGDREVVHHIIVYVRKEGQKRRGGLPAVAGFAPGEEPMVFPPGTGFKIPAGADLVWQVHYTPIGKKSVDRCEVGLVLCDQKPEREIYQGQAINGRFVIPPNAKNHRVVSQRTLNADVELISLMPHMHLRGKSFRYEAYLPDGTSKTLLNIPDYDFNWQHRYRLQKPMFLPSGTKLKCIAHFDNSAENPANPDPTEAVRWGDQTWEEMMIGFYTFVLPQKK